MPRQPRETAGNEADQRIEIRDEHGDVFERRAFDDLARDPIGGRFQLALYARVFLEVDGTVGARAPRAVRGAKHTRRFEQVGRQKVALVGGGSRRFGRAQTSRGLCAQEVGDPVEVALAGRSRGQQADRRFGNGAQEPGLGRRELARGEREHLPLKRREIGAAA